MKQTHLIAIIAILSVFMFGWFFVSGEMSSGRSLIGPLSPTPNAVQGTEEVDPTGALGNLRQLLYSASVLVPEVSPETEVVLQGEVTEYGEFAGGGASPSGTIALGPAALGNTDLIFTTITVNTGGSGDFTYLAAFVPQETGYRMAAFYGLGDRIRIDKFSLSSSDTVEIEYRVHGETQPMAEEPSEIESGVFRYGHGVFVKQ